MLRSRFRGFPGLWRDAVHSARSLARTPALAVTIVVTVGVGLGATTGMISVVRAVLVNPLPYSNADRIVTLSYLSTSASASGKRGRQVSVPDFLDWQAQSTSFDSMAYYTARSTSVMAGSMAEYAVIATVTHEFFRVRGAHPSVGRTFTREETEEGGPGAAIVSERYARQTFGDPGSAGVVRRSKPGVRDVLPDRECRVELAADRLELRLDLLDRASGLETSHDVQRS